MTDIFPAIHWSPAFGVDAVSTILLVLTASLFAAVFQYSRRYLRGDPGQPRFLGWLCVTGACVLTLILAQNLLLFAVAWCATSLSLHQLLQFYGGRPGARLAARKKFLISRLGDVALVVVLWLTQRQFGTWDFPALFAAAAKLPPEAPPAAVHWICGLLAFAALLKSAQFPFHSWLPDTMETPTPVSALMHAGIINAGGILVIRLNPLVALSEPAMLLLAVVGGFTAIFASTVMLTQASVKRCLAFSTVGQMGFLMMECGLGAFHLALLHMVAHSFYKAHAFLSTGSVVTAEPETPPGIPGTGTMLGALAAGVAIVTAAAAGTGVDLFENLLLSGILILAISHFLWTLWADGADGLLIGGGIAAGGVFALLYFVLEHAAGLILSPLGGQPAAPRVVLLAAFGLLALGQAQLPGLSRTAFGQRLFVHARNGFYMNTLANRFTKALWPVRMTREDF